VAIDSSEQILVQHAQQDPEAFGILFDKYYPAILRYCVRRVGDVAVAEDITAETFIKAYRNIGSFTWRGTSISPWFYKIATNEIRMYFRKKTYVPRSLDELYEEGGFEPLSEIDLQQEAIDAQAVVERQQDFVRAQRVLISLPVKYQEVITLRLIEKKPVAEVAAILGKKEGTIKSLLSRGLAKLRIAMEDTEQTKMQPSTAKRIIASERTNVTPSERSYED
jgi:RNA polymerase sigma-70 factor (ECF subfamily)